MSYSVIIGAMFAAFFVFGFFIGRESPTMLKKKNKATENQRKLEKIANNVANYKGNAEGQEKV
jgi:hypothetical protein